MTTVIIVISPDPSSSSLTNEEADEQPPSVGNFINHSMSVVLFTNQLLSQIKSGTLVMLVYGRETVLQVVHNRVHGFQKVLPCRGAQIATHTRSTSEKPNQNPTRPSRQSNHRIRKYFRRPPLKVDPQRS